MCGIVGFTGSAQAAPILLDGLSKLEYRGYDSAGLAVQNAAGKIEVVKAKGRLRVLSEMTDEGKAVQGCCGIGHTRWATHGEPSVVNAHPHYSRDQKIAVVHNGIIENYQELKTRLINKGFTFASQTDTEVVAQLLDYYYTGVSAGDSLDAITRMMMHVRGSYALGILFADQPGVVYAVRKDSPLIVGKAENGSLIASDVPALLKYTRTVYYIDNLEIARLTPDSIEFFNIDKEPVEKEASTIEWDADLATPLRWIGIASSVVDKIDYAASGGVSNPEAVVKAILAGATAVEVCSAVYQNTNAFIGESTRFLSAWMERKGFESIAQFKGKLNIKDVQGINTFERTQFLKYFGKKEN